MINRIRDIRREKHLTLADVAARCAPPTTAQTIGRLETGTRNLSLVWMNRIAAALDGDVDILGHPRLARHTDGNAISGFEALAFDDAHHVPPMSRIYGIYGALSIQLVRTADA